MLSSAVHMNVEGMEITIDRPKNIVTFQCKY